MGTVTSWIIGPKWETILLARSASQSDENKDYVVSEIGSALRRGIPVIPVLVRDTKLPRAKSLPPDLKRLPSHVAVHLRSEPDFEHDAGRIIEAIELLLKRSRIGSTSQL